MKKKNFMIWFVVILLIFLLYYLELPALNLSSPLFWHFFVTSMLIILVGLTIKDRNRIIIRNRFNNSLLGVYKYFFLIVGGLVSLLILINIISSPLFNAKEYSNRITVDETHEFIKDVSPVNFSKTPLIDKDSSQKLGDRKMGEFTPPFSFNCFE